MKRHPEYGAKVLENAESRLLKLAYRISVAHHEKWDGTGYPNGLLGDENPEVGRIVALADVYDALCTRRCYKAPWPGDDAVAHIARLGGTQFDPQLVKLFTTHLHRFKEIQYDFPGT